MKTVSEFYEEIRWNKELWEGFDEAVRAGQAEAFMKERGCDASFGELTRYLQSLHEGMNSVEELSLEELEGVAGGFPTLEDCIRSCFVEDVYVPWLSDFCPKCEFYFSSQVIIPEKDTGHEKTFGRP